MASIGFTLSGLDEVGPGDFTNKAIKPNFLHNVGKTHRYLDEVLPISVVGHGGAGGAELGPDVHAAEGPSAPQGIAGSGADHPGPGGVHVEHQALTQVPGEFYGHSSKIGCTRAKFGQKFTPILGPEKGT